MAKNDLTLTEVEHGKRFELDPGQYDELKTHFFEIYRQKLSTKLREEIVLEADVLRKAVEKEVRPKVRVELQAEIQKELETKFEGEQKLKLRTSVEQEIEATAPTTKQRAAARELAREIEIEALAAGRAASDLADATSKTLAAAHHLRQMTFFSLVFSFLPVLAYLDFTLGWGMSLQLGSVAIPYALAIIVCGAANDSYFRKTRKKILKYRLKAVLFNERATIAKRAWMVWMMTASTKTDLLNLISSIPNRCSDTERDEADPVFIPSADITRARVFVKDELNLEDDVESKFLRISDEPEESEPEPEERISVSKSV